MGKKHWTSKTVKAVLAGNSSKECPFIAEIAHQFPMRRASTFNLGKMKSERGCEGRSAKEAGGWITSTRSAARGGEGRAHEV